MNNSENLFFHAKKYQDERKAIIDAYEKRMTDLEDARGSVLYDKESKKAAEERDNALSTLKAEYQGGFNSIINEMRAVNSSRATNPPTEEELRIIQALKLKEKVTKAELDRIANAVKNNGLCLSVVQEMANKNGIIASYNSLCTEKGMTTAGAEDCINTLENSVKDFIDNDLSRSARLYKEYSERLYGKPDESKKAERIVGGWASGYVAPRKRPLFDTKASFYSVVANMEGDTLTAFCASVDN